MTEHDAERACRRCGDHFVPTLRDQIKNDYLCKVCRAVDNKRYRETQKRKRASASPDLVS